MIVHSTNGIKKSFYGVDFLVLSHNENTMLTKMLYKISDVVPMHSHPNEQCGYVISGKYRIHFLNYDSEIVAGDSYIIPANVEHSIEIIEGGEVLDCFNPPRKDYL